MTARERHGILLQEVFREDPWKLLVACIMLNMTTGTQVHKVVHEFFERYPNPQSVIDAEAQDIERIILSLGLYKKRAVTLKRFSHDYLNKTWKRPIECFGIGKYGNDSWEIFVNGNTSVRPKDKELKEIGRAH